MEASGDRYRLLETVRQYAQERMNESGDTAATCSRHLEFYLALAETARPELAGPAQGPWLARLDLERENCLSAHGWCEGLPNSGETGAAHGPRAAALLDLSGIADSWAAVQRGGSFAQAACRSAMIARCQALAGAGQMCFFMGRDADA